MRRGRKLLHARVLLQFVALPMTWRVTAVAALPVAQRSV